MATRERLSSKGRLKGRQILIEVGDELRRARMALGLSQTEVGRAVGLSRWQVSRIEHARSPNASLVHATMLTTVVGLDLSVRVFPGGSPLRDGAHLAVLGRLEALLPPGALVRREMPLPNPGDQRAWDGFVRLSGVGIGIEAETRLVDLQALARRIALKERDDARVARVVLLVADTRANRRALRGQEDALRGQFPVRSKDVLTALSGGRDPGASGIAVL